MIPYQPDTKIQISPDGSISVDLYLENVGQTLARDIYVNIGVTASLSQKQIYSGPSAFVGDFHINAQKTWHFVSDDFVVKFPISGSSSNILDVEAIIAISYSNIFDEKITLIFRLKAQKGVFGTQCCAIKDLRDSCLFGS